MSNFVPEKTALSIEFGSTRIKAVLIGPEHTPLAQGDYTWENQLHNGIWTYPLEQVWQGLQSAYAALAADVQQKYGCTLTKVGCIGISAMMHGYLAFDANGELLVPFRTWRNTITGAAAEELTAAFGFNIPQRWSIAHLYQAMLNKEEHLSKLDFFTTLAGYVHWQLTGHKVLGVGDASGMFPIDSTTGGYDAAMLQKFNTMAAAKGYAVDLNALLPEVLPAGADAGTLTEAGARLLDPAGNLQAGIPLCPPEGDAGTGMAATNSVAPRTGNVSAGTSIFAMVVLEKALSKVYPEIDMVTTPAGDPVAMVHCNNCTSDLNAWVELLAQNATHKDWCCTEELMATTKEGKALYLHCLPADINDVSCKDGEVEASVFDRYRTPLYKEASYKPYIIAAMILMSKVKDPVSALMALDQGSKRKLF